MIIRSLPKLSAAIYRDDWDWLENQAPLYADAVAAEVNAGASPDEIYRKLIRELGPWREPLAVRCRHAAQHLITEQGE